MRVTPTTATVPTLSGWTGGVARWRARLEGWYLVVRRRALAWARAARASERGRTLVGGRVEVQLPDLPGPILAEAQTPWVQEWLAGGDLWAAERARWQRWYPARTDVLLLGVGEGAWALYLQRQLEAGRRVLAIERRREVAPLLYENVLRPVFGHRLEAGGPEALASVAADPSWQFGLVMMLPEASVATYLARLGHLLTVHRPVIILPLFEHQLEREDSCADAIIGRLRGYGYELRSADSPEEPLPIRFNGWLAAVPPGYGNSGVRN